MNLLVVIISGIIGYLLGACKAFREAKQKAYQEILPPIIKMAYRSEDANEGEFCEALVKLWLYGSKTVAKKVDNAVSVAHKKERGNVSEALQEAIVEMRNDIQILPWPILWRKKLTPDEVKHIFTRIHHVNNTK